jgi:hypothetical protein
MEREGAGRGGRLGGGAGEGGVGVERKGRSNRASIKDNLSVFYTSDPVYSRGEICSSLLG